MSDQGAEGSLSPFLRRRRFAAAKPFLRGRILDIGCGAGRLAAWFGPDNYVGVEIDPESLRKARTTFPGHRFEADFPSEREKFDTVVALAVIEHVSDPGAFLKKLSRYLVDSREASIVCTTPHPAAEWIHDVGAGLGLFSKHANEEHEALLGRRKLSDAAAAAGLGMTAYRRFLLGANQLAVFQPKGGDAASRLR
jgi:SAM-dependent methyltransferase